MRTPLVVSLLSLCFTTLGCVDSSLCLTTLDCEDISSGVDRNKYLDELSASEATRFCKWSIEKAGGSGEHQCSENDKVTVGSSSECESNQNRGSHCLVSLAEDCMIDIEGDACRLFNGDQPQSCKDYFDCVFSGG